MSATAENSPGLSASKRSSLDAAAASCAARPAGVGVAAATPPSAHFGLIVRSSVAMAAVCMCLLSGSGRLGAEPQPLVQARPRAAWRRPPLALHRARNIECAFRELSRNQNPSKACDDNLPLAASPLETDAIAV